MLRSKLTLFAAALLVFLALLLLPLALDNTPVSICGSGAAAQEGDPCAAQNATIEAYQVVAAQATVDKANHKATVQALEALCNAGPTPVPGLPFQDDFAANTKGWFETETQYTAVRIEQGQLFVGAQEFWFMAALAPELRLRDFYAEATMTTVYEESVFVGFAVGNAEVSPARYHLILAGSDWNENEQDFTWYVRLYLWDGTTLTVQDQAEYAPFWQAGEPVRIALEASGGQYTLFVKGRATQTYEFASLGEQVGLVVYAPDNALNEIRYAYFDNLNIAQPAAR
ncbi:MAG: hypothetical protein JXB47_18210 [Anaerolineae bacterium]|nr:hypothetical protein [Anaerolineae bacterium]